MRHWFESAVERPEPNRGADMKDRSMSAPRTAMKALVRAWWAFDLAWRGHPGVRHDCSSVPPFIL